ncbi:MAG TPA: hypothetical protein VNS50_11060 [Ginsengibacter sp.]|nr:hypothetical protein [Ginsengibacter sp.]
MANYADYDALMSFLEESFSDEKKEIKSLNKYSKNERSFLNGTYDFVQISQNGDAVKYMVITFQDLPSPWPDLILEKIKTFAADNSLTCEYITWDSYKTYKNPVRER